MSDFSIIFQHPIVFIILCLFIIAFIIQVAIESWKFIYKMAPIFVPLLMLALLMYMANNREMEITNANHIESIENQSGSGG